jgi:ApaG protein
MSDTLTNGIRIKVIPNYEMNQSSPAQNKLIFSYRVKIINEGVEASTLISRHWIITNSFGQTEEVKGVGVIGETPTIYPGDSFEYTSFCPLDTEWGTMEGTYQMQQNDGSVFDAVIGRFLLSKNDIIKH